MAEYIDREELIKDIRWWQCTHCTVKYHPSGCRGCWVENAIEEIEIAPPVATAKLRLGERDEGVYRKAIEKYGASHQESVAVEECSELIQAVIHKHRGRKHNLAEEIADVEIMLEQLKIINDCSNTVEQIKRFKIDRLRDRVGGECR